jgi:hypothetical protein
MAEGKDYCDRKTNLLKSNFDELLEVKLELLLITISKLKKNSNLCISTAPFERGLGSDDICALLHLLRWALPPFAACACHICSPGGRGWMVAGLGFAACEGFNRNYGGLFLLW